MNEKNQSGLKFAVLIDSDNISAKYAKTIFDEIEKYGEAPERRIYGDWQGKSSWDKNTIIEYALTPVQQFAYTTGKNSTDIALVIDAMDILYRNRVDGFCLVTNDSDFTRLALRIREDGKSVIGMGTEKSAKSLTKACNVFRFLNLLDNSGEPDSKAPESLTSIETVKTAILDIINDSDSERINASVLGRHLSEKFSDFDTRNYGYIKLSKLLEKEFEEILDIFPDGNNYSVGRKMKLTEKKLRQEILAILTTYGGTVENMSIIVNELKKKHKNFDLHDYGYSRISSYLKSTGLFTINGSTVKTKK